MAASQSTALRDFSRGLAELVGRARPSIVSFGTGGASRSGFIWRDGLIVTAEESLPEEEAFPIMLSGGDTAEAKVVGRDPATDIAILKADRGGLHPLSLDAASPTVGALVVAVGAADGVPTAAFGIASRVEGPWRSLRGGEIDARILFDLRLPQSAEGGPVFDAEGKVIGMTVFAPRRRAMAIPLATIERIAPRLASEGRIPRGYLGVGLYPVPVEGSDHWGAMVMSVDTSGPAAVAGVHQGDVIVAWNGEPVRHVRSLLRSLGPDSVGTSVKLGLRRGVETVDAQLTIAKRPAA